MHHPSMQHGKLAYEKRDPSLLVVLLLLLKGSTILK